MNSSTLITASMRAVTGIMLALMIGLTFSIGYGIVIWNLAASDTIVSHIQIDLFTLLILVIVSIAMFKALEWLDRNEKIKATATDCYAIACVIGGVTAGFLGLNGPFDKIWFFFWWYSPAILPLWFLFALFTTIRQKED